MAADDLRLFMKTYGFGDLDKQLKRAQAQMAKTGVATAGASKQLEQIDRDIIKSGKSFNDLTNILKRTVAGFVAFSILRGIQDLFDNLVRTTEKFDRAMTQVLTLVDDSDAEFKKLRKEIRLLSEVIPKSPDDLGMGLYQTLSSGFLDAADATMVMTESAKLAAAGLIDTNKAVDAVTTVLNAYNLTAQDAGRVTDVFFETVKRGKILVDDLASDIGIVATSASLSGVALEELAAAIATMTQAGFRSEITVNALNRLFLQLIDAQDDTKEAAKDMGLAWDITSVQGGKLAEFINEIRLKTGGSEKALGRLGLDLRAFRALMVLAGNQTQRFNRNVENMEGALGAADEAYQKWLRSIEGLRSTIMVRLNNVLLDLGERILPLVLSRIEEVTRGLQTNVTRWAEIFTVFQLDDLADQLRGLAFEIETRQAQTQALSTIQEIREELEKLKGDFSDLPFLEDLPGLEALIDQQQIAGEFEALSILLAAAAEEAADNAGKIPERMLDEIDAEIEEVRKSGGKLAEALGTAFVNTLRFLVDKGELARAAELLSSQTGQAIIEGSEAIIGEELTFLTEVILKGLLGFGKDVEILNAIDQFAKNPIGGPNLDPLQNTTEQLENIQRLIQELKENSPGIFPQDEFTQALDSGQKIFDASIGVLDAYVKRFSQLLSTAEDIRTNAADLARGGRAPGEDVPGTTEPVEVDKQREDSERLKRETESLLALTRETLRREAELLANQFNTAVAQGVSFEDAAQKLGLEASTTLGRQFDPILEVLRGKMREIEQQLLDDTGTFFGDRLPDTVSDSLAQLSDDQLFVAIELTLQDPNVPDDVKETLSNYRSLKTSITEAERAQLKLSQAASELAVASAFVEQQTVLINQLKEEEAAIQLRLLELQTGIADGTMSEAEAAQEVSNLNSRLSVVQRRITTEVGKRSVAVQREREAQEGVAKSSEDVKDNITEAGEAAGDAEGSTESWLESFERISSEVETIFRGILGILDGMDALDDSTRKVLEGAIDLAAALPGVLSGDPSSIVQALGGIVRIAGGLFGGADDSKQIELIESQADLIRALDRLRETILDQISFNERQELLDTGFDLQNRLASDIDQALGVSELSAEELAFVQELSDLLNFDIIDPDGVLRLDRLKLALEEFSKLPLTPFADSLSGDLAKLQFVFSILGDEALTAEEKFERFIDAISDRKGTETFIKQLTKTLEEGGPDAANAFLDSLVEEFAQDPGRILRQLFPDLDASEVEELLTASNTFIEGIIEAAEELADQEGDTQAFQVRREITETSASVLISLLVTSVFWQERIAKANEEQVDLLRALVGEDIARIIADANARLPLPSGASDETTRQLTGASDVLAEAAQSAADASQAVAGSASEISLALQEILNVVRDIVGLDVADVVDNTNDTTVDVEVETPPPIVDVEVETPPPIDVTVESLPANESVVTLDADFAPLLDILRAILNVTALQAEADVAQDHADILEQHAHDTIPETAVIEQRISFDEISTLLIESNLWLSAQSLTLDEIRDLLLSERGLVNENLASAELRDVTNATTDAERVTARSDNFVTLQIERIIDSVNVASVNDADEVEYAVVRGVERAVDAVDRQLRTNMVNAARFTGEASS